MRNVVLKTIVGVGVTMMLSGCGKSAIKCDDSNAQKTVMEITKSTFIKQLHEGLDNRLIQLSKTFTAILRKREITDNEYQEEAERIYSESNPQLTNIRTEGIDNGIEKSECAAEIIFSNGNKLDITYKLSKTSQGDLYTEVSGFTPFSYNLISHQSVPHIYPR